MLRHHIIAKPLHCATKLTIFSQFPMLTGSYSKLVLESNNWHNFLLDCMESVESVESNNFYNLGTTLTTGHLTKLHLLSKSLLGQELMGCAWNQTTATTDKLLSQLIGGFRWNHGITGQ